MLRRRPSIARRVQRCSRHGKPERLDSFIEEALCNHLMTLPILTWDQFIGVGAEPDPIVTGRFSRGDQRPRRGALIVP